MLVICARTARTEEYSISPITRKTLRERKKIPSSDHRQSTLRERIAYSGHTKDRQTVIDRERDDDGHDHAELDLLQHS